MLVSTLGLLSATQGTTEVRLLAALSAVTFVHHHHHHHHHQRVYLRSCYTLGQLSSKQHLTFVRYEDPIYSQGGM